MLHAIQNGLCLLRKEGFTVIVSKTTVIIRRPYNTMRFTTTIDYGKGEVHPIPSYQALFPHWKHYIDHLNQLVAKVNMVIALNRKVPINASFAIQELALA